MAEQQQQFDWMKEVSTCVEGLKLDLETEYHFELAKSVPDSVSLHTIGKPGEPPLLFKEGQKAGQPIKMYTILFRETGLNLEFKMDFFHNESYRINPGNPELEDEIVKFSRKVGYNPSLGGDFRVSDFIREGLSFTAKLKELAPKGTYFNESGVLLSKKDNTAVDRSTVKIYKGIDINTIKLDASVKPISNQTGITKPSDEIVKKIQELAKTCKKFPELVKKINAEDDADVLLDAAMMMKSNGELKF